MTCVVSSTTTGDLRFCESHLRPAAGGARFVGTDSYFVVQPIARFHFSDRVEANALAVDRRPHRSRTLRADVQRDHAGRHGHDQGYLPIGCLSVVGDADVVRRLLLDRHGIGVFGNHDADSARRRRNAQARVIVRLSAFLRGNGCPIARFGGLGQALAVYLEANRLAGRQLVDFPNHVGAGPLPAERRFRRLERGIVMVDHFQPGRRNVTGVGDFNVEFGNLADAQLVRTRFLERKRRTLRGAAGVVRGAAAPPTVGRRPPHRWP